MEVSYIRFQKTQAAEGSKYLLGHLDPYKSGP
jgi:hypothetical protein